MEVDLEALEAALAGGLPLIDVRQPDEYEGGHVAGARLIPLGEVAARLEEVPGDGPVYVICHSGNRSLRVAQFLRAQGVEAYSVAGGTQEWVDSGRHAVAGPTAW